MADRIGVIDSGELILVEEKATLMKKLGRKALTIQLAEPLAVLPAGLDEWKLELIRGGRELRYVFDRHADRTGVPSLLARLRDLEINFSDVSTHQSSLEEIFVGLVNDRRAA